MKKKDGSSYDEIFSSITPQNNFEPKDIPVKPNYEDKYFWAAFPGENSVANLTTENSVNTNKFDTDCFFIHPTGFFLKEWNFKIDRNTATYQRTELMLATQASAFNNCSNVYAPEYRQATFAAISQDHGSNSMQALEIAYQDVKLAFEKFINDFSNGKPFFLAAHSQGALHAQRLLSEHCFKNFFKEKLLSAYLIGYPIEKTYLSDLGYRTSKNPEDLGSIIQFQTVGEGAIRPKLKYWMPNGNHYSLREIGELATTNPISWDDSLEWQTNNIDSLLMPKTSGISPLFDYEATKNNGSEVKSITFASDQNFSAKISKSGFVETRGTAIDRILRNDFTGQKDLHIWDYQVFWNHIRKNADLKAKTLK